MILVNTFCNACKLLLEEESVYTKGRCLSCEQIWETTDIRPKKLNVECISMDMIINNNGTENNDILEFMFEIKIMEDGLTENEKESILNMLNYAGFCDFSQNVRFSQVFKLYRKHDESLLIRKNVSKRDDER